MSSGLTGHLIAVEIDGQTLAASGPDAEHERRIAIYDLLESNRFAPVGHDGCQYRLGLCRQDNRLILEVGDREGGEVLTLGLSMTRFRRVVKDYFLVCENYFEAIRTAPVDRIEVLDMARRALHDEGSALLRDRLAGRIVVDEGTSRRLFTLICALFSRR